MPLQNPECAVRPAGLPHEFLISMSISGQTERGIWVSGFESIAHVRRAIQMGWQADDYGHDILAGEEAYDRDLVPLIMNPAHVVSIADCR